jgi:hypothetical protein
MRHWGSGIVERDENNLTAVKVALKDKSEDTSESI